MAIIETISPIIAVGMTYELHSTPFAVRLFQVDDSKDACSRYHKAEEVPAIAFVSSMEAGEVISLNMTTLKLFYVESSTDTPLPFKRAGVKGMALRIAQDKNQCVEVYCLDTGKVMNVPADDLECTLTAKWSVMPSLI